MLHKKRIYNEDNSGATAIEFSLLALPFVMTCACIIELGIYFATAFVLESAVIDASRLIKTGQVQESASGDQEAMFADAMCAVAGVLMNCDNLQYEVRKLDSFTADMSPTYNDDGDLENPPFQAASVTAGCVGLVRVAYRYNFMTPFFANLFGNSGTSRLMVTTTVFKTEPYNFQENANCSV